MKKIKQLIIEQLSHLAPAKLKAKVSAHVFIALGIAALAWVTSIFKGGKKM